MPKLDLKYAAPRTGSAYPPPLDKHCAGREKITLGDLGALTQFGVNLTRLKPGAASAHKHWHENEDEFVYMLEGEAVLVEDDGECTLRPGDAAAFKAGAANGHMLVNRGESDAVFLEVGTRAAAEACAYTDPDVDLRMVNDGSGWKAFRENGEAY